MKIKPEAKITAIIAVPQRKITSSSNSNNNSIKVTEAIISTPLGGDGGVKN
jgi:hypothetical protein